MRILVIGATGFIGRHVLRALLQQDGFETVAAVRSARRLRLQHPAIATLRLDAADCSVETLSGALQGFDVVINTVGIISETSDQRFEQLHIHFPRCLACACQKAGVRRFIHISALGACASASAAYLRSKHIADTFICKQEQESVIVKPSLVYGAGGASSELFAALAAQPVQMLIEDGRQQVQPVHIDDLVDAIVCLTQRPSVPAELEVMGPEALDFRDMLLTYRRWLGLGEPRVLKLPWQLVLWTARLLGPINSWVREDNLTMLRQGNTGSVAGLTQVLGRAPRALDDALPPYAATNAERWHARLYLLLPVLRLSVAFVWIFTGLTSLFWYPVQDSYDLLAEVGLTGTVAAMALYGAAVLDIGLGIALLRRWRPVLTGVLQLLLIAGYTLLISIFLPEYWLHPYGPITKNLPLMAAILILMAVERR